MREEKSDVFTFLGANGSVCFVICNLVLPFRTLYAYKRSPDHPRRAVVGSSVMMLLALLSVLGWIVFVTHPLSLKYLVTYSINLFDLTLLIHYWTAPSTTWKRRNTRKSFVVMAFLSVILVLACVLIFVGIYGVYF